MTRNNGQSINVVVLPDGESGRLIAMEGVRHWSDPGLAKMTMPNPGGIWDLSELDHDRNSIVVEKSYVDKALAQKVEILTLLTTRVDKLEKHVDRLIKELDLKKD